MNNARVGNTKLKKEHNTQNSTEHKTEKGGVLLSMLFQEYYTPPAPPKRDVVSQKSKRFGICNIANPNRRENSV